MKLHRLLALALTLCMLFVLVQIPVMAATDTDGTTGVRYDSKGDLLYKPEDVGQLKNSVVTSLFSPAPDEEWLDDNVTWKEEAYDIEFDYDVCAWGERENKWVAAYVGGTPYDVLTRVNFPTIVVRGLLQPLDNILPVDDERYFQKTYIWDSCTFGVNVISKNYTLRDVGELYGVWYNEDIFEGYGLETPLELWEKGEWTMEAFINAAEELTIDKDRDGTVDQYGWTGSYYQMFTIANGAKTVELSETGVKLNWNSPEYIRGLESFVSAKPYHNDTKQFTSLESAMHIERIQNARYYSKTSPECAMKYGCDAVWVPFPKGPDGYAVAGSISTGSETQSIGNGAKNIEGAKVWICADIGKFDYVSSTDASMMIGVDDATYQRALSVEQYITKDYFSDIGTMSSIMQKVWSESATLGVKAAIEKYTPSMQKQIDIVMSEEFIGHYHSYDNSCDTTCNSCGETRTITHTYDSICDATCNICDNVRAAGEHTYDNDCDTTCNLCGYTRPEGEHFFSNECDFICNVCGFQRRAVPHVYDNAHDNVCNSCGYEREAAEEYTGGSSIKAGKTYVVTTALSSTAGGVKISDPNGILIFSDITITANTVTFRVRAPISASEKVAQILIKNNSGTTLASSVVLIEVGDPPEDVATFVAESKTARVGETFTIDVSTKGNPGIVSLRLFVGYDATKLELLSIEGVGFSAVSFGPLNQNPISVLWEDVLNPNDKTNGVVAHLTFKVKETATAGDTQITITYDPEDVFDENYDNITFEVENGTLNIIEYIPGDVNGDGNVNNKDLGVLRQHLNGWGVTADLRAADVTGDGRVNNKDLGILRQYLNGWDVVLK